jgi:hypothetical protein
MRSTLTTTSSLWWWALPWCVAEATRGPTEINYLMYNLAAFLQFVSCARYYALQGTAVAKQSSRSAGLCRSARDGCDARSYLQPLVCSRSTAGQAIAS